MKSPAYTTQLGAGLGMINETRILLDMWQEGMRGPDLYQGALASGRFPTLAARRLHDLITVGFAQRYLVEGGVPAKRLKALAGILTGREFDQLLFIYTCRTHTILADFVRTVYWPAYSSGREVLTNEEGRAFVTAAIREGKTTSAWSPTLVRRVGSYLTGACADFGLLEGGRLMNRCIQPYWIESRVAAYLAHDLHFAGLGDNALLSHPDWGLFGLERLDVLEQMKRLALKGLLIVQAAGGITRISWQLASMEALLDVLIKNEL